eukprot:4247852-Pyramimonas_sp.AAC.1
MKCKADITIINAHSYDPSPADRAELLRHWNDSRALTDERPMDRPLPARRFNVSEHPPKSLNAPA